MKFAQWISVVFLAIFATACEFGEPGLSSFDKDVGSLIRKQCAVDAPCHIRLRDVTSFDWDEMYVFRPGLLDVEAVNIVPAVGRLDGEFNRKIVFVKAGKRVGADEAPSIIEGEHTPTGMLFFDQDVDGNPDALRYFADVEFSVKTEKWIRGDVYQLTCSNCSTSPVFAVFGVATQNSQAKP